MITSTPGINYTTGMSRLDIPEETTGKLEDTAIKTIQNKALKEKKKK